MLELGIICNGDVEMKIHFKSIRQTYLFGTVLTIALNDKECAWLGNGEEVIIEAPEGQNKIVISDSLRKKELNFEAKNDVSITLKRNRIWGSIETLINGSDVKVL